MPVRAEDGVCPFCDVEDTYWAQQPQAHSTISTLWKCDRLVHPLHTKTRVSSFLVRLPLHSSGLLKSLILDLSLISFHTRESCSQLFSAGNLLLCLHVSRIVCVRESLWMYPNMLKSCRIWHKNIEIKFYQSTLLLFNSSLFLKKEAAQLLLVVLLFFTVVSFST